MYVQVMKENIEKNNACIISCDGWAHINNKQLLNILCICSKGDFFCKLLIQLEMKMWLHICASGYS